LISTFDPVQPASYSLRSSASIVLLFPKGKMLSTFGDRSFSMAAPSFGMHFWQSCTTSQDSLSAFKSSLKTHILKLAFNI